MMTRDPSKDTRTKKCRALGCSKLVEDQEIFCSIHFPLIIPRHRDAIGNNQEPTGTNEVVRRRIISGTAEAVAYLAGLEGRKASLRVAELSGTVEQTSGGAAKIDAVAPIPGGSYEPTLGSFSTFGTIKFQEQ